MLSSKMRYAVCCVVWVPSVNPSSAWHLRCIRVHLQTYIAEEERRGEEMSVSCAICSLTHHLSDFKPTCLVSITMYLKT